MELPVIDPNILTIPAFDLFGMTIGPLSLKWYGLMYLLGIIAATWLANIRARSRDDWNSDLIADVIFYSFLGIVLGGRIGYVIFYQFDRFIADPMYLIQITEGGMSFHGGLIGIIHNPGIIIDHYYEYVYIYIYIYIYKPICIYLIHL